MAIFGILGFGFIYPSTRAWGSTATTGQFDFIPSSNTYVPVYDFNNTSVVRQESVINGHVEYVNRGNRQIVKITMHNLTKDQVTQLLSIQYKTVRFRPHTDNEDLEWIGIVGKVTPFYLKNINCLDHASFEIESQEFVELVVAD